MGLDVAAVVRDIAAEIGTTPSRIALAWTRLHPAIVASLVGAGALAGATGGRTRLSTGRLLGR